MSLKIFQQAGRVAFCSLILLLAAVCTPVLVRAQTGADQDAATDNGGSLAEIVKQLSSADPLKRQRAAEELARLEAADQRRLVEGYRLQEKNSRVRLALDWALYRFGKKEALFAVVSALDSSRSDQAESYLLMLDNPEPLYFFLERMNGNTQAKLLNILAKIGNAETIPRIKPYTESFDPKIVEAAKNAAKAIEQRVAETPANTTTRPRQVGNGESPP